MGTAAAPRGALPRTNAAISSRHVLRRPPRQRFVQYASLAPFLPPQATEITEPAAIAVMQSILREPVDIPGFGTSPVQTAFIPAQHQHPDQTPLVLLHSFDSSCLEYRRLVPALGPDVEAWAVDLIGWGFTDYTPFLEDESLVVTPQHKTAHLHSFWREKLGGRRMVLVGASIGASVAIQFALTHPEAVSRLVLLAPPSLAPGIGGMARLPRFVAGLGVEVLRSPAVRGSANQQSYADKQRCATPDALRVGSLHVPLPGWKEANVAFIRGGGFDLSHRLGEVAAPTLVLWGRQDEVLGTQQAEKTASALGCASLQWLDGCGHFPHLERPQEVAQAIRGFLGMEKGEEQAASQPSLQQAQA